MSTKACYRKLKNYKYQLSQDYSEKIDITGFTVITDYIKLDVEGNIEIFKGYAWDGASGPTRDTLNSMRGSLVHDALYQLLRMDELPQGQVIPVDKLFLKMIREDGMSRFRSWYWYKGLRLANGKAAKPGTQEPTKYICAPK